MKLSHIFSLSLGLLAMLTGCSKPPQVALDTAKVTTGSITQNVTATGTVESKTQVDVGTQVTGIIDKLYVDYNDEVHKGQLLAELEKVLLQSELNSAQANVTSAKATYDFAKANYDRDRQLHDRQLISDYEYQTTEKEYRVAKMAYEKSTADRVRAAKNLNYAEIYSPIDGVVISREVEVGQTVVSSMNVANLYVIADLDNMQIIGKVDEADIGQVRLGQPVTFTVDAYPDQTFNGTVSQVRLNPTTENNVVTYEVVVDTPNPEHKLIPGLTANLTILTVEALDVTVVPNAALRFNPSEEMQQKAKEGSMPIASEEQMEKATSMDRHVWVVDGPSLVATPVQTGVSGGGNTQVLSGLKVGQTVAVGYTEATAQDQSDKPGSPFTMGPPDRKKKGQDKKK